jgi:hypothetical protein
VEAVAVPLHGGPLHESGVEVTDAVSGGGSVIAIEQKQTLPLLSVTWIIGVPAHKPVAVGVVCPLGSHK